MLGCGAPNYGSQGQRGDQEERAMPCRGSVAKESIRKAIGRKNTVVMLGIVGDPIVW